LNFELNGQDATKDDLVPVGSADKLIQYGIDINNLNRRRRDASKAFDELNTKEGFQKYFDQADEVANDLADQVEEDEKADEKKQEKEEKGVEQPKAERLYSFVNKGGQREDVQQGREYVNISLDKAKVDKIDEDRYQVTAPSGEVAFYKTETAANNAATDINDDLSDFRRVKILAVNPDGTIKVEDINGDIQNISTDKLTGYEKVQTEQEKLQKFSDDINKEQAEIELNSGDVATVDSSVVVNFEEGKLKDANILFEATTSESQGENFVAKPHQARAIEFLNNVGGFDPINNTFNPFEIEPGEYLFSYTINNEPCPIRYDLLIIIGGVGPCETVVITLTSIQLSNGDDINTSLDALLPAGITGGTWTNVDNVGGFDPINNTFNPFEIEPGDYLFSYIISDGECPIRYDVTIIVGGVEACLNVIIHNAFTPNGDAFNQYFNIENIEDIACYPTNNVQIYNRWGVLVYETKNYDNNTRRFEGISEGRVTVSRSEELPTGTYFYIIEWTTSEGNKVTKDGYLYLTR
jgi:gliding motility-associated-like protein